MPSSNFLAPRLRVQQMSMAQGPCAAATLRRPALTYRGRSELSVKSINYGKLLRGVLIYIAKLTVCNAENLAEIRKVRSSTEA